MTKFMLSLAAVLCVCACSPAELAKTESTVEKIFKEVKCRAEVLEPYANTVTKDKIEEILTSKNAADALKETLQALEEDPAKVVQVTAAMIKCNAD